MVLFYLAEGAEYALGGPLAFLSWIPVQVTEKPNRLLHRSHIVCWGLATPKVVLVG